jgi:cell wall-associated NlpC family hydrolase
VEGGEEHGVSNPVPGPGPQQGNPQIVGTNQLAGQMGQLTRAISQLTQGMSRGASGSPWGALGGLGQQHGRGQQYYTTRSEQLDRQQSIASQSFLEARRRAREDHDRLSGRLAAGQISRGDYNIGVRRLEADRELDTNRFLHARSNMTAQRQQLETQHSAEVRMNRMAAVGQTLGAAAGAVSAGAPYERNFAFAQSQFYQRTMGMQPVAGATMGARAKAAAQPLFDAGLQNYATSNEDLFSAGSGFMRNYNAQQRPRMMNEAAALAMGTPGLGASGALDMQTKIGSGQGFYTSLAMGLGPSRQVGGNVVGTQTMAARLATQTFGVSNLRQINAEHLANALRPGGYLSQNIDTFASELGMDATQAEAMVKTIENQKKVADQFPDLSQTDVEKLFTDAAGKDEKKAKAARQKIQQTPGLKDFGETAVDVEYRKRGKEREHMLAASGGVQNALVDAAHATIAIKDMLQPVLEPFAKYKAAGEQGGLVGKGAVAWNNIKGNLFSKEGWSTESSGEESNWFQKGVASIPILGTYLGAAMNSPPGGQGGGGASATFGKRMGQEQNKQRTLGEPDHAGVPGRKDQSAPGLVSGDMDKVIATARAEVGKRYILGATGPDAWDCSSLVQHAFASIGQKIPRVTYDQVKEGVEVGLDKLLPGDLVFYGDNSHVGLYAGNGSVVEASSPQYGVVEKPIGWSGKYTHAKRIMSGGDRATGLLGGSENDATKSWGPGGNGGGASGGGEEKDILAAALAGGGGGGSGGPQNVSDQNSDAGESVAPAPDNPSGNAALGKTMAAAAPYGWTGGEWDALFDLWTKESNWRHNADNPGSDAYGIPQAMSNLYPETNNDAWRNSPEKQIAWGLNYIRGAYGSPSKALAHWKARVPINGKDVGNWYTAGAWEIPGEQVAQLHGGEMVLTREQASTVRQALSEQAYAGLPSGGAGGAAVTLTFSEGSVVINMPSASAEGAQSAAEQFVSFIAADERIKSLLGGW